MSDQESPLIFTDSAADKVKQLIDEEGNEALKLRVYVTGGGCSGFQYGFSFDENVNEGDMTSRPVVPTISPSMDIQVASNFERFVYLRLGRDPERLRAFDIPVTRVTQALGAHNIDIGARVLEMGGREYMIRGLGYLGSIDDIRNVSLGATANGTPIRVADVATVQVGPAPRRGASDGSQTTGIDWPVPPLPGTSSSAAARPAAATTPLWMKFLHTMMLVFPLLKCMRTAPVSSPSTPEPVGLCLWAP